MIDQYKRSGKKSCCEYHIISIYIKNKILLRKRNGGHKWVNMEKSKNFLRGIRISILTGKLLGNRTNGEHFTSI